MQDPLKLKALLLWIPLGLKEGGGEGITIKRYTNKVLKKVRINPPYYPMPLEGRPWFKP